MKVTSLTYSRGATINTGNFNSVRVDVAATVEVEEGENAVDTYEKARTWVSGLVKAEVANAKVQA